MVCYLFKSPFFPIPKLVVALLISRINISQNNQNIPFARLGKVFKQIEWFFLLGKRNLLNVFLLAL